MPPHEVPLPASLVSAVWRDDTFFQQFPLNVHTVLDYFSRSPFYEPNCNNEECKRQGLPMSALRTMKPGLEFIVTFASEPVLYVVKRQYREGPDSAKQQAFYYVLFGNIYQAPSLHACLNARSQRCLFHMRSAFDQLKRDLEPLAWREREQQRQVKKAKQLHGPTKAGAGAGAAGAGEAPGEEAEAAQAMVRPQEDRSQQRMQWLQQTDRVIVNVLSRYEVPIYEGPTAEAAATAEGGDGQGADKPSAVEDVAEEVKLLEG